MKQLFMLLGMFLTITSICAQSPERLNYQAVVRNSNHHLITNRRIKIEASILKKSAKGLEIYREIQYTTTNINGMFSLEIGAGTVLNGDFKTIDWGLDTYFVKIYIDIDNNGSFDLKSISQLLSVPYALHAKTAMDCKSIEGDINKAYIAKLDARITALERKNKATKIGDFAHGGVVFYIFKQGDLGYVSGEVHGLVCAVADLSKSLKWHVGNTIDVLAAVGKELGSGFSNTNAIVLMYGETEDDYAAASAQAYNGGGYIDWFLPSKDELNRMYINKQIIDAVAIQNNGTAFEKYFYWSATQDATYVDKAWRQAFLNGQAYYQNKNYFSKVRCIRAF